MRHAAQRTKLLAPLGVLLASHVMLLGVAGAFTGLTVTLGSGPWTGVRSAPYRDSPWTSPTPRTTPDDPWTRSAPAPASA
ncbi:hypothetical protein OHT52_02870 [Streptomyces sp. NBC_00247]|uniref:hypothetical protein n=1 Tax=Streptomyces sp. NBC_00247 TaxID=2975689 RepID=UPI002E2C2A88|nr:hypothetical protein [Streptomyces sp. NBC_00247]